MRPNRAALFTAAVVAATASVLTACSSASSGGTAVAVPASASGNGIEKKTAAEILAASKAAASTAASVHVTGQAGGDVLDLRLSTTASDSKLTVGGASLEVVFVDGAYYVKGDKAFWTQNLSAAVAARVAGKLAGKYVKETAAQAQSFAEFFSIPAFIESTLKPTGTPTKGTVTTIAGGRAIALVDVDGSKLFISIVAKPYPLLVQGAGTSKDALTMTDWNVPITDISAPPAALVIDLSSVTGG